MRVGMRMAAETAVANPGGVQVDVRRHVDKWLLLGGNCGDGSKR